MFSCEFCKISKNIFFTEHFWATASESSKHLLNGKSVKLQIHHNRFETNCSRLVNEKEPKFKGYIRYKTITSQNVSSDAQVKEFLRSILKIFKFLYF